MSTTIKQSRYSTSSAIENLTIESLIALLSIFATRGKKEPTADVSAVRKQYNTFCKLTGHTSSGSSEFDMLFQFLQSQGVIEVNARKRLVSLRVNWEDVEDALEGSAVMSVLRPHLEDPS
jgi:Cdc6-like AAA superfamily ATPase